MIDWMDLARCRGASLSWSFPEEQLPRETPEEYAVYVEAHATLFRDEFCSGCPVQDECLDFSLHTRSKFGVFAGLSHLDRKDLM